MKKTPFKMNPGFDALPGRVQAKIKGKSPNRFFGMGALQALSGGKQGLASMIAGGGRQGKDVKTPRMLGGMGAIQAGRKLMGSNNLASAMGTGNMGLMGMLGHASMLGGPKKSLMTRLLGQKTSSAQGSKKRGFNRNLPGLIPAIGGVLGRRR